MEYIEATKARAKISVVWKNIDKGETVTITRHGKNYAIVTPAGQAPVRYEVVGSGDGDQQDPVVRL